MRALLPFSEEILTIEPGWFEVSRDASWQFHGVPPTFMPATMSQ